MKVCKNCGEINPSDASFCGNCGKSVLVFQEEVVCPHCGAINDVSFQNCINCGNPLREDIADPIADEGSLPTADASNERNESYGGVPLGNVETAKCPNCGAIVPLTAIFCNKCGTSVACLHQHRVVQRKVCSHCGRPNKHEALYCSYCFGSLVDAKTEDMQVVHECENLGDVIVRQTYLQDNVGKKVVCPNCGALNDELEHLCVQCGLKLQIEQPKRYCPICGMENPKDSSFCQHCRWSFDGSDPDKITKWECGECHYSNDKDDMFCSQCGASKK